MTAVIEIYNEYGLQVTGSGGFGAGLTHVGSAKLVHAGLQSLPMVYADVTVTGINPVFAFKANGRINVSRSSNSGSSFTFHLACQSEQEVPIQYWIFDVAGQAGKDPTMSDVEVAIYDEFGVKTFDAAMSVMGVVDVVEYLDIPPTLPGPLTEDTFSRVQYINVPAGRVYAIVQSTPCMIPTVYDEGGYANGTEPPPYFESDGRSPPAYADWRQQMSETYHSTGGYYNANTIGVGVTRYERFRSWNPWSSTPFAAVYGDSRHLVIDVTNLASATPPDPTVISGQVNATTREVTIPSSGTSISPAVSLTISGGAAPYTVLWERVSGSTLVENYDAVNSTSFRTVSNNQPAGTVREAYWRAKITDNFGRVGYSQEVLFRHITGAEDKVPDPVDWANISGTTTAASFYQSNAARTISGINSQINIRATISGFSGSNVVSGSRLDIWVNGAKRGDSTNIANGSWTDANVNNNDTVYFIAHLGASNTASQATASYTVTITNTTTGQVLDTFTVNQTANAPDVTPDPTSWPNVTWSTNSEATYGAYSANGPTISGITRPITLRFEFTSASSTTSWQNLEITNHGHTVYKTISNYSTGSYTDITVSNGATFICKVSAATAAGRKTTTGTVRVINLTDGNKVIGTFNVNVTVDADDNYYPPDYTPDPTSWPNVSWSTNTNYVYGAYNSNGPTITGINRNIVLRFQFTSASSNTTWQNLEIVNHSHNTHATITNYTTNSYVDVIVANGETFIAKVSCGSDSGIRNTSGTVRVTNLTTGQILGTFTINVTVDADNNYNVADPNPNPISPNNQTQSVNAEASYTAGTTFTVSGIDTTITLRFTNSLNSSSGNVSSRQMIVGRTLAGGGYSEWFRAVPGGSVDVAVNNGDTIVVKGYLATSSGTASSTWTWYVTNQTTGGNQLGSATVTQTVDADNNYNVSNLSVSLSSDTAYGHGPGAPGEWTTAEASGQVAVTVSGNIGTPSLTWEKVSGSGPGTWGVSGTYNPTFSYFGQANFNETGVYRLKVTDSQKTVYSQNVTIYVSGGIQN